MGTTLTGTTPQDTYDSLIKVTDNGPLSGSLKKLTDGLGNDSSLSLSTTAASFSGTLAVTGNATFDTSTLVVDATNNLVGIGTATPTAGYSLSVVGAFTAAKGGAYVEVGEFDRSLMVLNHTNAAVTANLFQVQKSGTGVFTLTSAGNVGIGTSAPAQRLDISNGAIKFDRILTGALTCNDAQGLIYSLNNNIGSQDGLRYTARTHRFVSHADSVYATIDSDGLKFGSDTAAANALDDYEEGTWTPSLGGTAAYAIQLGTYTKIGRQVVAKFAISVTTLGTGSASVVSGLPFTSLVANRGGGGITYVSNPSTAYASINPFVNVGVTTVEFVTSTTSGVWADSSNVFTDNSFISGTVTYFV